MFPRLFHIYGPLWVHSYGLMIAVGISFFLYFSINDPKRNSLISKQVFIDALFLSIVAGIIGGRLLFLLEDPGAFKDNWVEIFYPWVGGLSSLGTILSIIFFLWFYLKKQGVKVLPFLDLVAVYAPLIHGFGRIGCFLAGCCHGKITNSLISIVYSDPVSLAPLHVHLIPTQIYESVGSFLIFFILRFWLSKLKWRDGQLFYLYLLLTSLFRFLADFWRGDWEPIAYSFFQLLSFSQLTAIGIGAMAVISFIYLNRKA